MEITTITAVRAGFSKFLLPVLRPNDAKSATLDSIGVILGLRSRRLTIGFGQIEAVRVKRIWFWYAVWLQLAEGNRTVSGLLRHSADGLADSIETARVQWWEQALIEHARSIQSASAAISQLSDPNEYQRYSVFFRLEQDAKQIVSHFSGRHPERLPRSQDIERLPPIKQFVLNSADHRDSANTAFVQNELERSKEFFDKIESNPLTDEQRRAVAIDEDHIVVGLCSGKYGFPTEITDDPLLDMVLSAPEAHPNAEERRLFYVAMTRAKRRVYLLAEGGPPSPFINELMADRHNVNVFGQAPEAEVKCPTCVEGNLERRQGNKNIFYGCSNYPYCEHTQPACPHCAAGLPVRSNDHYSCRDCSQPIDCCPRCDGWLQPKKGKNGFFDGCSNYPDCRYTRNRKLRTE